MRVFVPTNEYSLLITPDLSLIEKFLKYNSNRDGIVFVNEPNEADIIILFEKWSFKLWTYIDELYKCSLVMNYPDKVFTVNYDDHGRGFLPGLYTSLTKRNYDYLRHRACCYPKTINEFICNDYENNIELNLSYLFSFRGTIKSHPVRQKIVNKLSSLPDAKISFVDQIFHHHTPEQKKAYVQEILDSYFVLCPRGWSPTTYRLFEVMALSRCPVIIADDWVPIDGIKWNDCSIRIKESQIHHIPEILKERKADAMLLGASAKKIWDELFSEERKYQAYLNAIIDIYSKRGENCDERKYQKLWISRQFFSKNDWTLEQRIAGRIKKFISHNMT